MPKSIEHVHWPDAPDMWMPYAPAIKVRGGTTIYLAGVTAAPVYHHHPLPAGGVRRHAARHGRARRGRRWRNLPNAASRPWAPRSPTW